MFIKRDFATTYKQTILGPLWFLIQPLLVTIMFTIVFGKFGGFKTDGQPKVLFYLAGITIWNFFSETFSKSATVFKDNAHLFGKVYFPRLLMPLSIAISGLIRFGIQFVLFLLVWIYFLYADASQLHPGAYILLVPFLLILLSGFAMGFGMIFSALTARYRDLIFVLSFGIQLLMYATPVIYSLNSLPVSYRKVVMINPLAAVIEAFRFGFLGAGNFEPITLLYSTVCMFLVLGVGAFLFNGTQKSFMDTV